MEGSCENADPTVGVNVPQLKITTRWALLTVTPLKFNMEPEKKSLEKEIPFGNHHCQVPC